MTGLKDYTHYQSILRRQLPELSEYYGVSWLGLFGSYVRGDQTLGSDLDVLVRFRKTPGMFTYLALEYYLTDLLGIKVDLVMADSLKPRVEKRVLAEVVAI